MWTPSELNLTHKPFAAGEAGTARACIEAHQAALAQRALPVWTITHSPADLPGLYVARLHFTKAGAVFVTTIAVTDPTLEAVRACLPPGLYRMNRMPEDEPQIVETWL